MSLPDLISLLRLALVPVAMLLAWRHQAHIYFWVLLLALATDMVDGFLARRLGIATEVGARLDSYADLALFLTTPVCLAWLFPAVLWAHRYLLGGLVGVYLLACVAGYAKFRRLTSYHTYGAKVSAVLLGAAALGLFWLPRVEWLLYPAAVAAMLSYAEEIAITLTLPRWTANVPSWWAARTLARRRHP